MGSRLFQGQQHVVAIDAAKQLTADRGNRHRLAADVQYLAQTLVVGLADGADAGGHVLNGVFVAAQPQTVAGQPLQPGQ